MKKNKSFLSAKTCCILITASFLGMCTTKVWALTDNQLYINAYNSTVAALSAKTQVSINAARTSINALKGTSAAFAIGEFSHQVDTVQHPILVKAVNAITLAQTTPTQANINAAKAAIDPNMPDVWKNSYSQAVDVVQQKLISAALNAYNTAAQSKLKADVDAATAKLTELKTSSDSGVVSWANSIQAMVNTISIQPGIKQGTLSSVNITANGTVLTKTITPNAYKANVYDVTYTDGKGIKSVTQLYTDDIQAVYTLPAIGTADYADMYDLLLGNVVNNIYISSAKTALNTSYIDTNGTPVSVSLTLQGNNIIYALSSSFYKTVKYTYTPMGNGSFTLTY